MAPSDLAHSPFSVRKDGDCFGGIVFGAFCSRVSIVALFEISVGVSIALLCLHFSLLQFGLHLRVNNFIYIGGLLVAPVSAPLSGSLPTTLSHCLLHT